MFSPYLRLVSPQVGESDRVTFLGNTRLGQDVSLSSLLTNYHAVLCTYGAAEDRALGSVVTFLNTSCLKSSTINGHWPFGLHMEFIKYSNL